MNILVLTPLYYIKGREELFHDTNAIHYLVKYWKEMGHTVQVVVTYVSFRRDIKRYKEKEQRKYWKYGYEYEVDGINVYLIEEQLIFNRVWDVWKKNYHLVSMILKYLRKIKFTPDIIVNHMPVHSSVYIKKLGFKVPTIGVLHMTDVKKGIKNQQFLRCLEQNYTALYCRSSGILEKCKEFGLNNLQEEIIYSGAPMCSNMNSRKFDFTKRVKILYVGKLIGRKNVDLLIRIVAQIPKLELCILGEGNDYEFLKNLTVDLKLNEKKVCFLGFQMREHVLEFMSKSDIFCMPSVNETFGLVYIEAMSQGCIVIGTKNEGIDGVIRDGENGFLCDATIESIEGKIKSIMVMGKNDIEYISKKAVETGVIYSEKNVSKQYLNLITQWKIKDN